jgi:hypothetical protein
MSKNRLIEAQLTTTQAESPPKTPAGRVVHDSRGNAVWDWAVATDVLARKTVAELITTLDDATELSLEGKAAADSWTGDPYNRPAKGSAHKPVAGRASSAPPKASRKA